MTVEATDLRSEPAGGSETLVGRSASRRDSVEAVALLVAILGVLLVVVLILGVAPPGLT
ncbi:MAG TPA: hypothetical protein VMU89_02320 [Thermomicrobiaceae bacterium]|nr:hypothetical protein [Thermomicrobiaceae bacterium]